MTDCIRCNGAGHLAIVGDDDVVCPACGGAGEDQDAVVSYYAHRYHYGFLADMEMAHDLKELNDIRDAAWYRAGWYEVLGYDRQGRSYETIDDELGDLFWSMGAEIERENDAVYSNREMW